MNIKNDTSIINQGTDKSGTDKSEIDKQIDAQNDLRKAALHYHKYPQPGKIALIATKPMSNQRDLALAYSPGVAFACEEIQKDPMKAADYTSRANLVAVISNGTAVLGLGNIGALAGKPVMEGKGVLFKKFSGINVFDIEIDEKDPKKLVDIIASLEPTFGGINLEDIKAPECFYVEQELKKRMKIPVFHDDQHGTAIVCATGVVNALKLLDKKFEDVKLVCSGAGAAAIACLNLLVSLGLKKSNILVCDSKGVINQKRDPDTLHITKKNYQANTAANTLDDAIDNADIFLGLSGPGTLTADMVKKMARDPLIFALANPEPEIRPELAMAVRPDAILATGRSDYPNQINNVLCFPYLFRGALDCGAIEINEEMKLACVRALAELAHREPTESVINAYAGQSLRFGRDYLIPKPFDERLIIELPLAVARAAEETGVALRPITDYAKYRETLSNYVRRTNMTMKPIFEQAKKDPKTIIYCEGEDERVLRAAHIVKTDQIANPVLIGRPDIITNKLLELSITLKIKVLTKEDKINKSNDLDYVQVIDINSPPHFEECVKTYHGLLARHGVTPELAKQRLLSRGNLLAAMLVRLNYVDGEICGVVGQYHRHIHHLLGTIDLRPGVDRPAALSLLLTPKGPIFFCDTHINDNPNSETLANITLMAAAAVKRFGITPKIALLSHSNFGSRQTESSIKMQEVLAMLQERAPDLEIEGEMQPDLAIWEANRFTQFPDSKLTGSANLLIFPNLDAANIAYNLVKAVTDSVVVGPILMGFDRSVHVLTNAATSRRVVNLTAMAVTEVSSGVTI
ncbi:malate dehydrogenase [Gammaproteobacteria bacterium]|nr:malate dehydrogenase [Gammaproteobacteria bacterium]